MVTEIYLPIWGGAENQLRQLIPYLQKRGCQVSIVTRRWHDDWSVEEVIDGVKVSRVGIPGRSIFATLFFTLSLVRFVISQRARIDILHSHGAVNMGAFCSILAKLLGKKNVAKIASAGKIESFNESLLGQILLGVFKRSGAIISMTDEIDQELMSIDTRRDRIHRITNGVDVNRFYPKGLADKEEWCKQNGLNKNIRIVLFSGRIVPVKGLDVLLGAWPKVIEEHPDTLLLIVGSGDDQIDSSEKELKELVDEKDITKVMFYGATEQPESLLRVADIFVFPSRKEGFPNALMEAMATGLPVLASDIGGVVSLIEDGRTGFIFPSENSVKLAKKLSDVLDNLDTSGHVGSMARLKMKKYYSFDETSRKYVSLYRSLLNISDDLSQKPLMR